MSYPYEIAISDPKLARQIRNSVKIGSYFVFEGDRKSQDHGERFIRRMNRLLIKKSGRVFPLANEPVSLEGMTITPKPRPIETIGCVVTDRELYRADGQESVNLFMAFPSPPESLSLIIECNGEFFARRNPELTEGVGIEVLSMPLPGSYSAQLETEGHRIGRKAFFTVAEYQPASLSARLTSHTFSRHTGKLLFALTVESCQTPFGGEIIAEMIQNGREIGRITIQPLFPGQFEGRLGMKGEGPFRLRLTAGDDPGRMTEIAIPDSLKPEWDVTVISEFGPEMLFSMMPEPDALPVRGGYLTRGDFLGTPLIVEKVVTDARVIQVCANIESLVLVSLDLLTGCYGVQEVGSAKEGDEISVAAGGKMSMVFAGGFVNGHPFEGYTAFVEPGRLSLSVETPETIRPGEALSVHLGCEGTDKTVPVLLCVRDERLTAADTPEAALGAAVKRGIDSVTKWMDEGIPANVLKMDVLKSLVLSIEWEITDQTMQKFSEETEMLKGAYKDDNIMPALLELLDILGKYIREKKAEAHPNAISLLISVCESLEIIMIFPELSEEEQRKRLEAVVSKYKQLKADLSGKMEETSERFEFASADSILERAITAETDSGADGLSENENDIVTEMKNGTPQMKKAVSSPVSTEFPKVLFYGIIPVSGTEEVVIPMGDSPGRFAVEAFALSDGDWTQIRRFTVYG